MWTLPLWLIFEMINRGIYLVPGYITYTKFKEVVPFEFGRVTISPAVGNQLVTGGSPEDMKIAMESVFVATDSSPLLNR